MTLETVTSVPPTQPPAIPRYTKPGRNTPLPAYTTPPTSRSTSPSSTNFSLIPGEPQSQTISSHLDPSYYTVNDGHQTLNPPTANSNYDATSSPLFNGSNHTDTLSTLSQHQPVSHPYQPVATCPEFLPSTVNPSQQMSLPSTPPMLATEVSNILRDVTLRDSSSPPGLHPQQVTPTKHVPTPLQLDQGRGFAEGYLLPPLSPPRHSFSSPTSSLFSRSRSPSPSPYSRARLSQSLSDGRLDSSYHQIIDDQKYFTAFAQSQTEPILAIASAAKSNNKIYFYNYASSRSTVGSKVEPLTLKASLPHPTPIYSLAWSSNHLLSGGANGVVQLYQVDSSALSSPDPSQSLLLQESFQALQLNKFSDSPGGYMAHTTRVNRVQFASDSTNFLTTAGTNISIWNIYRPHSPEHKCSIASQAVYAAQLSPHADSHLYAFGGMDRQLRIMDRRDSGDFEAMLLTEAHRGAIRDIQWNPYVPYWLASCGDDGQIKVWDLRFQSRAMVEMGEYGQGFYQSLAWSNVHCDIISSSSRDRAFQVWKLGVQWSLDEDEAKAAATGTGAVRPRSARVRPLSGGHMVGTSGGISSSAATAAMTLELAKLGTLRRSAQDISSLSIGSQSSSLLSPYHSVLPTNNKAASESYHKVVTGSQVAIVRDMSDASIVQILPSNQDPGTFLTITSAGILATHTLRSSTLDTLAPHRDPSNTFSREYEIERSLYHRNLTDVCHQLLDWVRSGENESSDKKAKAKRTSGDKTGKDDHSYPPINPREMLDTMTRLPPAGFSSQSWTLPSSSNPSTPSSPSYPADQLQVPHHHDSSSAVIRRRRFSAQIFSTDRSRSRSPSISSVNSDSASSTDRKLEPTHLAAFIKDFERYTLLQLPPAFPLQLANQPLLSDLELQIANVAKREELIRLSRDHQAQALVDRLDEISDMALRDPLNMDIGSLCQILSCVMDWDHVQGLRMARTLVGYLSSQSSSSTTCTDAALSKGESAQWWPLVHMAMFPTIFDRSMVHCGPESYEAYKAVRASGRRQMLERFTLTFNESKRRSFTSLKTPVLQDFETAQDHVARSGSIATILDMLDFEIQVQSHLVQEPHFIPAHIVLELFHPTEYQGCKMTISQQAMSIYFEATSATGQWGDYFETLERLLCNFSYVLLDNQGQPNGWFASSIKAMEEAILESSSLLAPPPTFHHQGSPSTTIVASPMSMSNGSGSVSSSWPPSASSGSHVTSPSPSLCPPPALISHFLWAHFDLYGLPALREQVERLLDQPPQALMQTHPIVLESWILALGRLIKVWWGGEKVSSVAKCDSDNHSNNAAGVENMTIMAAVLGGAPMAKMVLNRRLLEFQFDTVAGRFFQRISVGSNNPEQTREIAERQANALMDQLRSNGLLKRKNQSENPVPEADRLYQALLRFLRAGFIEQPVQV